MLKHNAKRIVTGILAGIMVLSATACTKKEEEIAKGSEVIYPENGVYPVQCADELTAWCTLNSVLSTQVSNLGETEFAKQLEEKTGVKVSYIHPAQGQNQEQFNLLLASGDLPDLVQYSWVNVGAQSCIDDGYILKLNDIIDKWAPNFKNVLASQPEHYDKAVRTDEGNYYVFPGLSDMNAVNMFQGPVVRGDWLTDLGLDVPETIDDWTNMLRKFKNEKGCEMPLSANVTLLHGGFAGAFGVYSGVYLDDGKVVYGPAQDGWKDYLAKMNEWYEEGLLDQNIASFTNAIRSTNILNGHLGSTVAAAGSGIATWMSASDEEGYSILAVPYPVKKKGIVPEYAIAYNKYTPEGSYAISANCKNPELAARFLDYGYSDEGHMLFNFGPEGVTYNLEGDDVKMTSLILDSPQGVTAALANYCLTYSGPCVGDVRQTAIVQGKFKESAEAVSIWKNNNMDNHLLPLITPKTEEQTELNNLLSEIDTFVAEKNMAYITGEESLDTFDEYQAQLEKFGLSRLLEIYETALERYNKR